MPVIATSYLLGVSTRRVEKLAAAMGVTTLSKSQASVMAAGLGQIAESFRGRRLDAGPCTFAWIDALTQKVREGSRTVSVHCLIATGVNAGGTGRSPAWTWPPGGEGNSALRYHARRSTCGTAHGCIE